LPFKNILNPNYFKDSGEPIKLKAGVDKVMQFADSTPMRMFRRLSNKVWL